MGLRRSSVPMRKEARRALGVVCLTVFIDLAGFSILFPLGPAMLTWYLPREGTESLLGVAILFFQQFAADDAGSAFFTAVLFGGILGSLYSLLQFLSAPFWGRLSDRYGRRRILLITISGTALSYIVWFFSGAFWLLILSRLFAGLMAGNIAVATAAVSDITTPAERAKGMALIGVAFGLGFIIGPALGAAGALIDLTAWFPGASAIGVNPFSVAALIALLLSLLNLWQVRRFFPETAPVPDASAIVRGSVAVLFRKPIPGLARAGVVYFLFLFVFSGMEFTLTFLAMERLGYGPVENVRIFLFVGVVLLLTQGIVVRRYAHRIGEKTLAGVGLVTGPAAMLILALSRDQPLFFLGLAGMGLAVGLVTPTIATLVSFYAPDHEQGRAIGSLRGAGALARAIGPITAALIYWRFGSAAAYGCGGVLLLLPLLVAIRLPALHAPSAEPENPGE